MNDTDTLPRLLTVQRDVPWAPIPNELHLILADTLPPLAHISTAFALAFSGDALLLSNLSDRGWDVPGGHLRTGEAPEAAMRRETYEETGVRLGDATLIGYQMVRVLAAMPPQYRYPYPESYQVFYVAHVLALDPFTGNTEAIGRDLFPPAKAATIGWVRENRALYDEALTLALAGLDTNT